MTPKLVDRLTLVPQARSQMQFAKTSTIFFSPFIVVTVDVGVLVALVATDVVALVVAVDVTELVT